MRSFHARPAFRMLALLAVIALAFGAAACGDSDDDGGNGGATAADGTEVAANDGAADGGSGGDDKEEIADTMRFLLDRYNRTDGVGFCSRISKAGHKEIVDYFRNSIYSKAIKSRDCAGIVKEYSTEIVRRLKKPQVPIEVKRVTVNGDKGKIIMKGGLAGLKSVTPFQLVKEDGQWKVVDPLSAAERRIRIEN